MHRLTTAWAGRRLLAALGVSCLLAVTAGPVTATATEQPTRLGVDEPSPSARAEGPRGTSFATALGRSGSRDGRSGPHADGSTTTAGLGFVDVYYDYCDDAETGAVDLAEARIHDAGDRIGVRFTACGHLDAGSLGGGIVVTLFTGPDETYLLDLYLDPVEGPIGELFDAQDRSVGYAPLRFTGEDSVEVEFPTSAIGDPPGFQFLVASFVDARSGPATGADGATVGDVMPEAQEPPGLWPGSCHFEQGGLYTVETADRRAATRSLAAAGIRPTPVDEEGRFTVSLLSDAAAEQLARRDGISAVTRSTTYRPAQASPGADQVGVDAWWRVAARVPSAPGGGAGIDLAIVDTGVDGSRSEFGGRVGAGYDGTAQRPLPAGTNSSRGPHGNHVAGIAGASQDVIGTAPAATLRPYQAFYFDQCGDELSVSRALAGAVRDGVDVINMSLAAVGGGPPSELVRTQIVRALDADITVVAAAGNSGYRSLGSYPASEPGVVAVGATDRDGGVASYTTTGPWMDLVAPGGGFRSGHEIWSLGSVGLVPDIGTSMATPMVAGAAARYLAAGGDPGDVQAALRATAAPVPGSSDPEATGAGALDVGALLASLDDDPAPSPGDPGPLPTPDIEPVCTGTDPSRFTDIPETNPHRFAAQCLAHLAIASGYADGTFRPRDGIDRGQMATFVVKMLERHTGQALPLGSTSFPDVTGGVHADNIGKLAHAGIVSGFEDGTYQPGRAVTRDQMATFLVRALEREVGALPHVRAPFDDIADSRHRRAIDHLWYAGITSGDAHGDYRPRATVRRDQMASFVARSFAFLSRADHPESS